MIGPTFNHQDILHSNKPPLWLYGTGTVVADPSYAHYIIEHRQSHMLPYSTLYVAIVTLQRFSVIYIQQDGW